MMDQSELSHFKQNVHMMDQSELSHFKQNVHIPDNENNVLNVEPSISLDSIAYYKMVNRIKNQIDNVIKTIFLCSFDEFKRKHELLEKYIKTLSRSKLVWCTMQ